jgi:predicted deacylase
LQICHPAPISGFFERAVELGQIVRKGDRIGNVLDPLGENATEVRAEHDGLVIGVVTFSRVMAGTGLAVILKTNNPD